MKQESHINLKFCLESRSTLWNVIFEGFDQEVIIVSKFYGNNIKTIKILHKFAVMIQNRFKDWYIETDDHGIVIRKLLPNNSSAIVNKWEILMFDLRDNINNISKSN